MLEIVKSKNELCTGCNRCVRECPMETACITYMDDEENLKVRIDHEKCIACGRCILACKHEARYFLDDTERFFDDLMDGTPISLIVAPAIRTNIPEYKKLFTYLKQNGVNLIYDVSIGADICIWAHIRYIEENPGARLITQPCPPIVSYIEKYCHDLLPKLSPVHSPMACTYLYMKKYLKVTDHIAALSPCIAKTIEFEDTNQVNYNITFDRLTAYLAKHNITLPDVETDFDHDEGALGCLFPMPGGLMENLEFYLGHKLHVAKFEGFGVYDRLVQYSKTDESLLPDIFDVLNCIEGCNRGSAASHERGVFEIEKMMSNTRVDTMSEGKREQYASTFKEYSDKLKLSDFIRTYIPVDIPMPEITDSDIGRSLKLLGKTEYDQQHVDCSACGSDTCYDMARKIALNVNLPVNCIFKSIDDSMQRLKTEANKAYYDVLTGICNRRYFDENVERTIKSMSRHSGILSLLMIDIDHFKLYNDTYGHDEGDNCLKTVAKAIANTITRTDDFAARYGGEEFVVVLPNTDKRGARLVAEKLLENVRNCKIPHAKNSAADHVTISIGITTGIAEHRQSGDIYVRNADKQLYESKKNGRNTYSYVTLNEA